MQSILLDTHVWIWLMMGSHELQKELVDLIQSCANKNKIFISSISLWEIVMLENKKRIVLDQPILDWLNRALSAPGVNLVTLSPEIAVESTCFPKGFQGDPADRIIVATAKVNGFALITRDKKIIEHSQIQIIKA